MRDGGGIYPWADVSKRLSHKFSKLKFFIKTDNKTRLILKHRKEGSSFTIKLPIIMLKIIGHNLI